jgi:uncharacterized radical SAM protein YgiQ
MKKHVEPLRKKSSAPRCLPMSLKEMRERGWEELDILIITGDAYVDHPSFGAALIGRAMEAEGWRVGIISQPEWRSAEALKVMGRPRLFCGITAGNLDSMLAHYTASRQKRKNDDYSEGGRTGKRPNLATVVYAQLARQAFPGLPVVLGGIEASLRRLAHYDYWRDQLRPSVLSDSKADILVYGMAEQALREVASKIAAGAHDLAGIRGTACLLGAEKSKGLNRSDSVLLPSLEECRNEKRKMLELTRMVEAQQNPHCGKRLIQFHGERALIVEPPSIPLSEEELDRLYGLPFTGLPHPFYRQEIPAYSMVKDSITVVRGCPGGCAFCSLGLHQGKFLTSRTIGSVVSEIKRHAEHPDFKGTITDLGGPTANLYGCRNNLSEKCSSCRKPSCLYPGLCIYFGLDEERLLALYRQSESVQKVKHVFIGSGIRMDVALKTPRYMKELFRSHVSGHLKAAPEHLNREVLKRMRKPEAAIFYRFLEAFEEESRRAGKEQYLVPYFISSFPGCTAEQMKEVRDFLEPRRWQLRQVQDYIPLPMTPGAAMYYSGLDYESGRPLAVARGLSEKKAQKDQLFIKVRTHVDKKT